MLSNEEGVSPLTEHGITDMSELAEALGSPVYVAWPERGFMSEYEGFESGLEISGKGGRSVKSMLSVLLSPEIDMVASELTARLDESGVRLRDILVEWWRLFKECLLADYTLLGPELRARER